MKVLLTVLVVAVLGLGSYWIGSFIAPYSEDLKGLYILTSTALGFGILGGVAGLSVGVYSLINEIIGDN